MAALTADTIREFKMPPAFEEETFIIENNATLYLGSQVVLDTTSGHAQPAADSGGTTDVVGIAVGFPDVSNVGNGTRRVRVRKGVTLLPCIAGLYVTASIGDYVHAEDDNLVTDDSGSANKVKAGRVIKLGDATNTLWVDVGNYPGAAAP